MTGPGPPKATGDLRRTSTTSTQVPQNLDPDRIARMQTVGGRIGKPVEFAGKYAVELDEEDEPQEDQAVRTGRKFILTDECWAKHAWTVIVMVLLAYTATIFLYRFTFVEFQVGADIKIGVGWTIVGWIVDCLFWLDLVLNFFLSYRDNKGNEVDSPKLIALRYLRLNFWVDLVACIPEAAYLPLINLANSETDESTGANFNKALRIYRLQKMSRLARLTRVTRLTKLGQLLARSRFWQWFKHLRGVRIVSFIFCLFWVVHFLACGWYLCAALHVDVLETWVYRREIVEQTPAQQWICAMYWVLMVFTTVGFGDIIAVTEAEMGYCAFTMVVGAVIHSIVISEVIGIVTSTNEVSAFIGKQVHLVEAFSAHTQLDPDTARTMKSEITWRAQHWAITPSFDKAAMRDLITGKYMPRWLVSQIPQKLFGGKLVENNFLRGKGTSVVPPRLPSLLAMSVLSSDFLAGEIIYQVHDFPFNLFLVLSGTFAVVGLPGPEGGQDALQPDSPEDSQSKVALHPYRLFSAKSYFGDLEMIMARARPSTCRCERNGTTLTLHKKDYMELVDMFPDFAVAWKFAGLRREHMRKRCLAQLKCGRPVKCLAATQIQRHFRRVRQSLGAHGRGGEGQESSGAKKGSRLAKGIDKTQQHQANTVHLQSQVGNLQKDFDDFKEEMRSFRDEFRMLLKGANV
eukprot:CAMPEP_0179037158 /NCGR_PEP_ID=MMETSP0796-20121207/13986_1 /TAXON_ID=73915 /ORGANISM="Pyrodinium bahamense, Strain pbaha01" /LENGTH=685 /DNA_ID=CAMNT_0020733461 /DNA_START=84 /DNA_END=2141 /DNA_ORIENTATION=+